ncbi:tryptophan--tRNA ligase [Macrococcoides caseolyticum]|uniref:tryptophan--tRNA ligase n=1 Tax=Macrococcoides caseolyticum TaxID=69966 RepID=UPI001EEF2140|nr:tryptophan--tRNA ligase [Macrococcus caseolyticus]MCE4955938.1 tryptophan--tRNA ligase [Macrococcus caseolyticus]
MKKVLTGIKPTGELHLGNYLGAIKPAIALSKDLNNQYAYFIADIHALNNDRIRKVGSINELSKKIAAAFFALGLDTNRCLFYKQSDIPQITEMTMYLMNETSKGLLNRAHAYKAKVQDNVANHFDPDKGVNMGLFNYPVLMAADILIMDTDIVPVGKDQLQHIEITRDIAQSINNQYGEIFKLPVASIDETTMVLPGNDGRKMSKSYGNTIPIFSTEKELYKNIMKIKTESIALGEPIPTQNSIIYTLFKALLNNEEMVEINKQFEAGVGYGNLKKNLFEVINNELKEKRNSYYELLDDETYINDILIKNQSVVRNIAQSKLDLLKDKMLNH